MTCCILMLRWCLISGGAGELKTKPTQHSVKELRSIGITPDILGLPQRASHVRRYDRQTGERSAMWIKEAVIQNLTTRSIYQVPTLSPWKNDISDDKIVLKKLDMPDRPKDMAAWHDMVARILKPYERKVTIAVVGKIRRVTGCVHQYYRIFEACGCAE